ncbi:winged helix-turn-helix transcriptional regulator [Candidatus Woesearchaeota archaeon]|nr:winged helix-turn-helix transcriptional regulator [Candidatus Woesearchaeota archaeon]
MNQKDLRIIANLRKDARMPLTKMSRLTHIPVSTIFDRLKMNEDSLIIKHTSLLDFNKLGYNTRANISFKVDREDKEAFKEAIMKSQCVNSVYKINNGFDFMVEGIFKQIKDMEDFLESLEQKFKILEKKSFFIIEDLKREAFMTNENLILN